jgi:tryptophan synthase alpha chain
MANANRLEALSESIRQRAAAGPGRSAIVSFVTAGYPTREGFIATLMAMAPHVAAIEVGVPFSDPMADGVTIQESSRVAIANGVTLDWILSQLGGLTAAQRGLLPPIVLMGYLNPFLSMGLPTLAQRCAGANVAALIIPDLPLEEGRQVRAVLAEGGTGLVQLVSPVTPEDRAVELCQASDGFVYAVATLGVTGGGGNAAGPDEKLTGYLRRLKAAAGKTPVCAGFGISSREQVQRLAGHCDGVIVGSAVIKCLEQGRDVGAFVRDLAGG